MLKAPKISVIIPIYKVEKYLKECLNSVINQTYKNWEIICVDDCSPDNSAEIVKKYIEKDNRIKLFRHTINKGHSGARNTGLENAAGDLIYFLDSDDYIEPNLFECAVNVFENFDIDFFCFSSKPVVEGKIRQSINDMKNYIKVKRDGIFNLNFDIMQDTNIHVWNKIYIAEKIRENNLRFIEGLLYEDIFFTWAYNFLSHQAYYESEPLHNYRIHAASTMEKNTKNKSFDITIDHMKNWHELFKFVSKNKGMSKQRYNELLNLLYHYRMRAKEICPLLDKYKIEKLYFDYLTEITENRKNSHKVINFCGIKLKIKIK